MDSYKGEIEESVRVIQGKKNSSHVAGFEDGERGSQAGSMTASES